MMQCFRKYGIVGNSGSFYGLVRRKEVSFVVSTIAYTSVWFVLDLRMDITMMFIL